MKIKNGFMLKKVGGQNVVVAVVESGAFYCVSLLVSQGIPNENILEC